MRSAYAALVGLILLLSACRTVPVMREEHEFDLLGRVITVVEHRGTNDGHHYVVLHDNEDTAASAARWVVRKHGGVLFELSHDGQRNVSVQYDGVEYRFDPNRIFTPAGTAATLADLSDEPPAPDVENRVAALGEHLISLLTTDYDGLIVAVHNNTEQEYGAKSYLPSAEMHEEAEHVHIESGADADDFFFTTSRSFFDAARSAGFNAVLQRSGSPTDDGSLSVFAEHAGIPYVNVEAQHGHLRQQRRMLAFVHAFKPAAQ